VAHLLGPPPLEALSRLLHLPDRDDLDSPAQGSRQKQAHPSQPDQQKVIDAYPAGSSVYELADQSVIAR